MERAYNQLFCKPANLWAQVQNAQEQFMKQLLNFPDPDLINHTWGGGAQVWPWQSSGLPPLYHTRSNGTASGPVSVPPRAAAVLVVWWRPPSNIESVVFVLWLIPRWYTETHTLSQRQKSITVSFWGKFGKTSTGSNGFGLQCFRLRSLNHAAVTTRFKSCFAPSGKLPAGRWPLTDADYLAW